jgi:hypothetical protein
MRALRAFGIAICVLALSPLGQTASAAARLAAPTLNAIADPAAIPEDSDLQTIPLSGITTGGAVSVAITAASSNTALIPHPTVVYTSPGANASLTYTPVADASGSAVITVTVTNSNGESVIRSFVVDVLEVNDPPTADVITNPATIDEDSAQQTISVTGIDAGSGEALRALTITATSSNPNVIPNPTVDYVQGSTTATLRYTPVANTSGTAVITVTIRDAGGAPVYNYMPASVVVGQPDFTSNLANQGGVAAANTLRSNAQTLIVDGKLLIADSQNNRVLIYNTIPTTNNASADVVIGQVDFAGDTENQSGVPGVPILPTARTLDRPAGLASDGTKLFVLDRDNHRVLIYNEIPTTNNAAADVVIGHDTMEDNSQCGESFFNNSVGVSEFCLSSGPTGLAYDAVSGKLIVYDSDNDRVLIYNSIPTTNGAPASVVVGQSDFTRNVTNQGGPIGPRSLDLSTGSGVSTFAGKLLIADRVNHRVLIYNQIPTMNDAPADVVIGQPDFSSNSANQGLPVGARAFNGPRGPLVDSDGRLYVPDAGNARILVFDSIPTANNAVADFVIGQPSVTANTPATSRRGLQAFPYHVTFSDDYVAVADGTSNRVLLYPKVRTTPAAVERQFAVGVAAVDDPPTLDALGNVAPVPATAGPQTVALTGISAGGGETQTLSIMATSSNPAVVPHPTVTYESPSATGALTFRPATNATGTALITVTVIDSGAAGRNTTSRTFTVTVTDCGYTTSPVTAFFSARQGQGTAAVSTHSSCAWTVDNSTPWIHIVGPLSRSGVSTVAFTVDANATGAARAAAFAVAGRSVVIQQAPAAPAAGDMNGDGETDLILWHAPTGTVGAWLMRGLALEAGELFDPGRVADTRWRVVGSGDFNRDGQNDLLWQHSDGSLAVWLMRGTTRHDVRFLEPARLPAGWTVRAVADVNADGFSDVVIQHTVEGWVGVWMMNAITLVDGVLLTPQRVPDTPWRIVGSGDFDGDGRVDLAWQHDDGRVAVWLMNGTSRLDVQYFSPSRILPVEWQVVGVGDVDRDGTADLLLQHASTGDMAAWLMNRMTLIDGRLFSPSRPAVNGWLLVGPK